MSSVHYCRWGISIVLGHLLCAKTVIHVWQRWIPLLPFQIICLLCPICLHCHTQLLFSLICKWTAESWPEVLALRCCATSDPLGNWIKSRCLRYSAWIYNDLDDWEPSITYIAVMPACGVPQLMLEQNFYNTIILVTVNIQNLSVVTVSIIVRQTWAFSKCLKCPEGESQSMVQNSGSTMPLSISFVLMPYHYFDLAHMWTSANVSHSPPISRLAEENKNRISHGNVPQSFSLAICVLYFLFNLIIHVWQNYRSQASGRTICPSSSFTAREKFWLQRLWHAAAPHHCRLCKSFSAWVDSIKPSRHKIICKVRYQKSLYCWKHPQRCEIFATFLRSRCSSINRFAYFDKAPHYNLIFFKCFQ